MASHFRSFIYYFLFTFVFACLSRAVYIDKNGYKNIVISFSNGISHRDVDFSKLKSILQKSSDLLKIATRRRAYFADFIIVIPPYWPKGFCPYSERTLSAPREVSIHVTHVKENASCNLHAQHSRDCGKKGEIIYMPLSWLKEKDNDKLAREFVQQWATYRYGVFEETPVSENSCLATDQGSWFPVGCYNVNIEEEVEFNNQGLPLCSLNASLYSEMRSSLMFTAETSTVQHFCDGSTAFPHDPTMPTRHNALCDGRSVWSVIEKNPDFLYGKNPPMADVAESITTKFSCLRETASEIYFAVQTRSSSSISAIVSSVRYSLLRFILYDASPNIRTTVLPFSDEAHTEQSNPFTPDVSEPEKVRKTLTDIIWPSEEVENVCLTCALKKILQISTMSKNENKHVVLIALASAVKKGNIHYLVSEINKSEKALCLILIQDAEIDDFSFLLVDAILRKDGKMFILPNETVIFSERLNVVLMNLVENSLHIEEQTAMVYEAEYRNVKSSITEKFFIENELNGRLLYTINCNLLLRLESEDTACTPLPYFDSDTYQCAINKEITQDDKRKWEFKFKYRSETKPLICTSIAVVKKDLNQNDSLVVRGWLSHKKVYPGKDALVIYAEVLKNFEPVDGVNVEALVYEPGSKNLNLRRLELRDNGNGDPDVKLGDGIYSRYFTQFVEQGTHFVSIHAKAFSTEGNYENESNVEFQRVSTAGSFTVVGDIPTTDVYSPNKIGDLKVTEIDHEGSTVTLQWTAPGNNLDDGFADMYHIKYSTTWSSLTGLSFDMVTVKQLKTVSNENIRPLESGSTEKHILLLPNADKPLLYYIALKSVGKEGNSSPVSNIIQVYHNVSNRNSITTETYFSTHSSYDFNTTQANATEEYIITDYLNTTNTETTVTTTPPVTKNTTDGKMEDHLDFKYWIIIIGSAAGAALLLIILINVIVCICCLRRKDEPKKLSRKDSMIPPHNMSLSYKSPTRREKSDDSIETSRETIASATYSDSYNTESINQYAYHNANQRLRNAYLNSDRIRNLNTRKNNEFQTVRALPAYASTSLVKRGSEQNQETELTEFHTRRGNSALAQPQQENSTTVIHDAQLYPLGLV